LRNRAKAILYLGVRDCGDSAMFIINSVADYPAILVKDGAARVNEENLGLMRLLDEQYKRTVARVNQVWSTDITYIRMAEDFGTWWL